MNRRILIGVGLGCALFLAPAHRPGPNAAMDTLSNLRSEKPKEREEAVEAVLGARHTTTQAVLEIAREFVGRDDRKGTAKSAIILLGQVRATEAVPFLVEQLDFLVFYKESKRPQPTEDAHPCVDALIRIGLPSLKPLLGRVQQTEDEKILRLASVVFEKVLDKKAAVAFIASVAHAKEGSVEANRIARFLEKYLVGEN